MLLHAQILANSVAWFSASFAKIQGVLESETQIAFATPKIEREKKGLKAKFTQDYNLSLLINQLLFCRSHRFPIALCALTDRAFRDRPRQHPHQPWDQSKI
jgi:hypothetical protein